MGYSITYEDGHEIKGCADRGGLTHDTLNLEKGEYIIGIEARTGHWWDAMCFKTSKGRELRKGGGGGGERKPVFEGKSYLIAIEGTADDHLKNVKCYYVDLKEVKQESFDPLKKLIAESDLLSRGFERNMANSLSKDVIKMITDVE